MMGKRIYEIDGVNFSTLDDFFDEISRILIPDVSWGRNLSAFDDILQGGFGTPDEGFVLRWRNSKTSRERLGYGETVRVLKQRLASCHPSNEVKIRGQIVMAQREQGTTVFDWLVEILQNHGVGGRNSDSKVELELC